MAARVGSEVVRRRNGACAFSIRAFLRDRCGAAAVEFGIALPVFLLFTIGLIEFGRILWTDNALQFAADEAGRYAIANPAATTDQIQIYATGKLVSVDPTQVTITVTLETAGGVNFVTVTTATALTTPFLPISGINLTGRSRVPLTG